jgi:hypothetical protein
MTITWRKLLWRWCAIALTVCFTATATLGCGRSEPPAPVDDSQRGSPAAAREETGMSTRKKVVLLAGAAALYYLYKKHQNAKSETGPDSQYYLSKNGRVYYRDAEHRAHWVTPPSEGISVPADQAHEYRDFQGYENSSTGRDLRDLGNDAE